MLKLSHSSGYNCLEFKQVFVFWNGVFRLNKLLEFHRDLYFFNQIFKQRLVNKLLLPLLIISVFSTCETKTENSDQPSPYLEAVTHFADNVLEYGQDRYGDIHSPLLADGINVKTGEPVRWEYKNNTWIISNLASQQNLMRTFVGLSALTGDQKYRDRAAEIISYMYDNHTDKQGLLYWGGHQFVDLETMENQFKGRPHELKNNYPFYEFMWEVDPHATRKLLQAIWNTHILDWRTLDLNRHGEYDLEMGDLWDHKFEQPKPFYEGEGLTFINAGTDMVQSALSLYLLDGDEDAKEWGIRLYEQYVRARHPETGLGVYQYSQPVREETPPQDGPLTGEFTFSKYGDRAANQFGATYGDVALEGNVLWGGRMETLYGRSPVMILYLAEQLGETEEGNRLLNWAVDGLSAYANYAYSAEENEFKPMWADGTDLTGQVYPRTGYYGEKGTPFPTTEPEAAIVLAAAKGIRLTNGDKDLWSMLRSIFMHEGLGDPGESYGDVTELNLETNVSNPTYLVSVLELYKATSNVQYLTLAERIGDNILDETFADGFFRPSEDHIYTRFDRPEPLALLMLEAARQGDLDLVPPFLTGYGSTDGEPEKGGRPTDEAFYEETYND